MMAEQNVGIGEFTRWMEHLSQQNRDILSEQRKTNGRVTTLEVDQKVTKRIAAYISAGIALGISVGGFILTLIKW